MSDPEPTVRTGRGTPTRTSIARSSKERLATLFGGVAAVKAGAATETQMKENKHRVEDALQATRAALEEGIVPGGGLALPQAANAIRLDTFQKQEEKTGAKIALRALEQPLRQIAHHPGLEGSVIVMDVRNPRRGRDRCHHQRDRRPPRRGGDRPRDGHAPGLQNAASIAKNILTI